MVAIVRAVGTVYRIARFPRTTDLAERFARGQWSIYLPMLPRFAYRAQCHKRPDQLGNVAKLHHSGLPAQETWAMVA